MLSYGIPLALEAASPSFYSPSSPPNRNHFGLPSCAVKILKGLYNHYNLIVLGLKFS